MVIAVVDNLLYKFFFFFLLFFILPGGLAVCYQLFIQGSNLFLLFFGFL